MRNTKMERSKLFLCCSCFHKLQKSIHIDLSKRKKKMAYVIENLEVELATGLAGPRCSADLSGIYFSLSLALCISWLCLSLGWLYV